VTDEQIHDYLDWIASLYPHHLILPGESQQVFNTISQSLMKMPISDVAGLSLSRQPRGSHGGGDLKVECQACRPGERRRGEGGNKLEALFQTAGGLEAFYPAWGAGLSKMEKQGLQVMRLGWIDSPTFDVSGNILDGVRFIHEGIANGENVLVNCAQGKSRSASLVIAYLMTLRKMTYAEALEYTRKRRAIVEPNYGIEKQLQSMEAAGVFLTFRKEKLGLD
jgi:hypothetical protein